MKKQQNNSTRAWALQIALSVALLSISAVLLASSFKATPAASGLSAPIEAVAAGDNDLVIAGLASARSLCPAGARFTFSNTGSLNTVRYGHTATLLPSDHFSRTSSRRCRMGKTETMKSARDFARLPCRRQAVSSTRKNTSPRKRLLNGLVRPHGAAELRKSGRRHDDLCAVGPGYSLKCQLS